MANKSMIFKKLSIKKISFSSNSTINSVQSKKLKTKDMKKIMIITAATLLIAGSICFIAKPLTAAEKPVSKNINLEVYKTASYISSAYAGTTATLEVTVIRVKGDKRDTAFQHTFQPKQLKDYPASDKPMLQEITIPILNDRKERLEIYYRLTYDTKGSVLNFLNTATIGKGKTAEKLNIKI
jgi:energy-converting hydrogenase Eha subunit E